MPEINVRRLAGSDAAAMAAMRRMWTEENAGGAIDDPGFEARFAEWIAGAGAARPTWVAEAGGRLVGMVNLAIFDRMPAPGWNASRWGYLANAYVVPEYRNAGVGRLLVDELMAFARREELVRVVLSPSAKSVPFYERAGFGPADMLMAQRL